MDLLLLQGLGFSFGLRVRGRGCLPPHARLYVARIHVCGGGLLGSCDVTRTAITPIMRAGGGRTTGRMERVPGLVC